MRPSAPLVAPLCTRSSRCVPGRGLTPTPPPSGPIKSATSTPREGGATARFVAVARAPGEPTTATGVRLKASLGLFYHPIT